MNTNLDCYFDEMNDDYRDYLVRKKIHGRMAKRVNKIEDTLRDRKDMMSSLDFNDLNFQMYQIVLALIALCY